MPATRNFADGSVLGRSVWVGNCADAVFGGAVDRSALDDARALWDRLEVDPYLHDGGSYRQRRYAELAYEREGERLIHTGRQVFFQSADYNRVNGGQRQFSLIEAQFLEGPLLAAILRHFAARFADELGVQRLELYLHQVRIVGRPGVSGRPTPEGIHKDGVDFSCQILFGRNNVHGGESLIYDNEQVPLLGATMLDPLDFYCFRDRDIFHSVSEISPADGVSRATRDILGVEFCTRRQKPADVSATA